MHRLPTFSAVALALLLAPAARAQQASPRTISGTVTDSASGAGLPLVQVAIRSAAGATPLAAVTDSVGRFAVRGVLPGTYSARFIRLGYSPVTRDLTVAASDGPTKDIGTVAMSAAAVTLSEVNVVADQAAVVHAADRDIYSADAVAGAAGGAASDVLRGIPDLEVDIAGRVTMHGQAPAIYINGRPAPMTGESLTLFLEQFAAANIKSVEVMANPSARYDAEGAGGIVNIVLKENASLGISGNAFVNAGTRGEMRGGGRATFQRGPLTLNGGASAGRTSVDRTSRLLRENLLADPVTFLEQEGRTARSTRSANLDLGARYDLRPGTQLSAEARVDGNRADAERVTRYTERDAAMGVTDAYDMLLDDDGSGHSVDLALELEHRFGAASDSAGPPRRQGGWERGDGGGVRPRDHQLEIEVEFERGGDLERSVVERRLLEAMGDLEGAELTWEEDRETESEVAVGVDYTRGIGAAIGMEIGYDGQFGWTDAGRFSEVRDAAAGAGDGVRRDFVHRQTVHGGYVTLARELGALGAQFGVRAERSDNRLELPGEFGTVGDDHVSIFPNANLTYSLGTGKRLRLSYSMRVRRPTSGVLNPINTSSEPLERRVGNPSIEPQYTHSYMLNASWSGKLGYLRATPFFRRSTNEWEQVRDVDGNGIATTTYDNLGSTDAYGLSVTGSVRDFHGIGARVSASGQHTRRDYAAVLGRTTPASTRWSLRGDADRDFGRNFSAQGSLTYTPARDLPQGRASSTLMTRVGLRFRFADRRASLNVGITDPFDIYDSSVQRSSLAYVETGRDRVSMRRLTASVNYSFQQGGGVRRGRR